MRTYGELSPDQQQRAVDEALREVKLVFTERVRRQLAVDLAGKRTGKVKREQRRAVEQALVENRTELRKAAEEIAKSASYPSLSEAIIYVLDPNQMEVAGPGETWAAVALARQWEEICPVCHGRGALPTADPDDWETTVGCSACGGKGGFGAAEYPGSLEPAD